MKKHCRACNKTKEVTEFWRDGNALDGLCNKCIACKKAYRSANIDHIRQHDRERQKQSHRKIAAVKNVQKLRSTEEGKRKHVAQYKFSNAITAGKIKRPSTCSKCGCSGRIEGHHKDYSKPFDVVFLCTICHNQRHKEIKGEKR